MSARAMPSPSWANRAAARRSEEHTSELQSHRDLHSFPYTTLFRSVVRGQHPAVRALDGVSFDVGAGDAVAIVGESGCGKTTLGRLMLKLAEPTSGSVAFAGMALSGLDGERLRAFRRQAQ